MIKNGKQLKAAERQIEQLQDSINSTRAIAEQIPEEILSATISGYESQISDIKAEIDGYHSHAASRSIHIKGFSTIPTALIGRRLGLGLTHKQLAKKIGWKPQQIQRYEKNCYETASWKQICKVADALEFKFTGKLDPEVSDSTSHAEMFNILIVDDEPNAALNLEDLISLTHPTWRINTAHSAKEAFGYLEEITFDLVITDLVMDSDDCGLRVLKKAKEMDGDTMVIIVTAYEKKLNHNYVLTHGVFDCISKTQEAFPASEETLIKAETALKFRQLLKHQAYERTAAI